MRLFDLREARRSKLPRAKRKPALIDTLGVFVALPVGLSDGEGLLLHEVRDSAFQTPERSDAARVSERGATI